MDVSFQQQPQITKRGRKRKSQLNEDGKSKGRRVLTSEFLEENQSPGRGNDFIVVCLFHRFVPYHTR